MIEPISPSSVVQNDNKRKLHKKLVSYTGYTAMGFGTVCWVTGMKSVKFANKMTVHKISAYLAGIATVTHFAIAKGLDKLFQKDK